MQTWLHFVGRSYYTPRQFIAEAQKHSVTRRVALRTLQAMQFGDRVLLATHKNGHAEVFGMFWITNITGLSPEALDTIARSFRIKQIGPGGLLVQRRCGAYIEGPTYTADALLGEIAKVLKEVENPGKLMIGGMFMPASRFRLKDISFQMGFRRINYDKLLNALTDANRKDRQNPLLKGQFYVLDKTDNPSAESGYVQTVYGYHRAPGKRKRAARSVRKTEQQLTIQ